MHSRASRRCCNASQAPFRTGYCGRAFSGSVPDMARYVRHIGPALGRPHLVADLNTARLVSVGAGLRASHAATQPALVRASRFNPAIRFQPPGRIAEGGGFPVFAAGDLAHLPASDRQRHPSLASHRYMMRRSDRRSPVGGRHSPPFFVYRMFPMTCRGANAPVFLEPVEHAGDGIAQQPELFARQVMH